MSESTSTPATGLLDPALLDRYLKALDRPLPDVQPDTTPSSSGLFTRIISKLGEFAGSPGPETLKALSPREREDAGLQALSRFGTGLLQASGSGQWIGSNLGSAFARAEKGYDQTGREAVGNLAARQGYAVQQQQDQLARIKEALPLLTLQQQQALVGRVPYSVGGGGGGGGGSFLDALASIESGDQNIVSGTDKDSQGLTLAQGGNASEISQGHFQIQTATWKDFAKQAGVDIAQYPTAMSAPREVQAQVAAVIPLSRFGPRTQDLLRSRFGPLDTSQTVGALAGTPALTFAPGTAGPRLAAAGGAPAPPAPVGTQPPGTQVATPPPVQVAGPGAGTSPAAAAAPPGPVAEVPWLPGQAGPGLGSLAPAPTAAAPEPTASATPPPPAGPPVFSYRPSQIPPGLIPPGTFTPAQQQAVKAIEAAYVHERQAAATPADVQKAESNFGTNMTKVLGSQTDAAKVATDALLKFHEADYKQQQDTHARMLDDYLKQQQAEQAQKYKLAEIAATAGEARTTAAAGTENAYVLDERKRFGTERDAARTNIDDLQMLKAFSDAAGTSTPLENIRVGDRTGRDLMVQWGFGTEAAQKKWGAQQAFEAAVNKTVTGLRQGMSMGQLSDRDMAFIQHMAPSLLQNPQTRNDIIAYLEQAQYRKLQYADAVEQLWDGGKGVSWGRAKRQAQAAQSDYVPNVPNGFGGWEPVARRQWLQTNVRPGSLLRGPDGRLSIYQPPSVQGTP